MKCATVGRSIVGCVILDFDGIILQSTNIKTDVFREIFSRYPDVEKEALEFHLSHKGMSRYEKFGHFVNNLLGLRDSKMVDSLAEEFGDLVEERLLSCPFVPGSQEFLVRWHGKLPLFVASTSPPAELNRIVKNRNLDMYFHQVLADPGPKAPLLKEILRQTGIESARAVFIGDSPTDFQAAMEVGVSFIGVGDCPEFRENSAPEFL